jgi:hypothetical protein
VLEAVAVQEYADLLEIIDFSALTGWGFFI